MGQTQDTIEKERTRDLKGMVPYHLVLTAHAQRTEYQKAMASYSIEIILK